MQNIQQAISTLEHKVKKMTIAIIILASALSISIFSRFFDVGLSSAQAQSGYAIAHPNIPVAIEAQSFVLKDKLGNIRGMWSADDNSTTFATSYNKEQSFISMNVNKDDATLTISDERNNQIFLTSSNTKGQSLTMGNIHNPSHNVLLGYNNDETNFELMSRNFSRIGLSGKDVLIEALGQTTDFVIADHTGNYINLNASNKGHKLAFIDKQDYENVKIEHTNGESIITLISPASKARKVIKAN